MTVEEQIKTRAKRTSKKDSLDGGENEKEHKDIVFPQEQLMRIEAYGKTIKASSYNETIRRGMDKLLALREYLEIDPNADIIIVCNDKAIARGRLDSYTK